MSPINLYEWNYGAPELLAKLKVLFERDGQLLGMVVQRSIVYTSTEKKRQLALVRIDVLKKDQLVPKPTFADYETIAFRQESFSREELLRRMEKLQALEFVVGEEIFHFERGFGFSTQQQSSNNAYSIWPGKLFEILLDSVQLPQGPLLHHELNTYDSVYEAIKEFLEFPQFHDHADSRIGHALIYVPNFNARIGHLDLVDLSLRINFERSRSLERLILQVKYGSDISRDQLKVQSTNETEVITLKFKPTELKLWLFSTAGELIDFHEETQDYSRGSNAVLPKRKQEELAVGFASPMQLYTQELDRFPIPGDQDAKNTESPPDSNDVFVIHGHNANVRQAVADFLRKLGLNPIVLSEQANKGLTIIEKFEKHSNVRFAVALLTGDDLGRAVADGEELLRPRPRQNVILELGYFMAKLGRGHVCALLEKGVEIPSDYSGVLYISLDKEDWQFLFIRELKSVGLNIDANKIFE